MYIPLHRAPESAPASAFSRLNPAAEYSTLHSRSAEQAHRAHPPQAHRLFATPQSSQSPPHSTMDHSRNVHTADRQTTAASSSFPPQPQSSPPTAAPAHRSPAPSAQ